MDVVVAREIAKTVAQGMRPSDSEFFIALAIWALVTALAGFVGTYLGKRAEQAAIKAGFDDVKAQLAQTTKITAQIQKEVERVDWTEREWIAIRIRNLEVFHARLHENVRYAKVVASRYLEDQLTDPAAGPSPAPGLMSLQKLYYPELKMPVARLLEKCTELQRLGFAYFADSRGADGALRQFKKEKAMDLIGEADTELLYASEAAGDELAKLARSLFTAKSADEPQR